MESPSDGVRRAAPLTTFGSRMASKSCEWCTRLAALSTSAFDWQDKVKSPSEISVSQCPQTPPAQWPHISILFLSKCDFLFLEKKK